MKIPIAFISMLLIGTLSCKTQKKTLSYASETLKVEQISANAFQHISYLETDEFGKVACNGVIVKDKGEAVIIDTPGNEPDSKELIDWVEQTLKCKVVGVVATHFHIDCLGGLQAFHDRHIASYASNRTIDLAKADDRVIPENGFDSYLEIKVGNKKIVNEFLGEGHTKDNIIVYFPSEKVLFGGCLIKSVGAGKGNLEDANTLEWSETVEKVKTKYARATIIVPGHGKRGGPELLDYTIELFKNG